MKKIVKLKNRIFLQLKALGKDDKGVATIFTLIVAVIVLCFCLTLLMVSYTLFAQTNRQTSQLQCKLLAQSFSEQLKEEIDDKNSDLVKFMQKAIDDGNWRDSSEDKNTWNGKDYSTLYLDGYSNDTDYEITVEFTYSLGQSDDDGEDEPFESGPAGEPSLVNCVVNANIICKRDIDNSRSDSYYALQSEYTVPLYMTLGN